MLKSRIAGHALALVATLLLGGFLSATLVRPAPGFDADEQQLDPHLGGESVQALRAARQQDHNVWRFYFYYMKRATHGDLGTSLALAQPVRTLLRDRAPLTLRLLALGLGLAWVAALSLALTAAWLRSSAYDALTIVVSGTFLCIPAAVLALLSVLWNVPGSLAIALIVFPHIYRYARNLLVKSYSLPHIITARAKGLGRSSHPFLARRSHGSTATAGGRRCVGQYGGGDSDSRGSPVRTSWRWTTRMASGDGA